VAKLGWATFGAWISLAVDGIGHPLQRKGPWSNTYCAWASWFRMIGKLNGVANLFAQKNLGCEAVILMLLHFTTFGLRANNSGAASDLNASEFK
jgi:hypothetical protein